MLVKWMKLPNKKITFESFLCGTPARDYINQYIPYEQQIKDAAEMIQNAEYVLIGAGAGMSTAAGAQYGGKFFEENFGEFQKKYGKVPYMQDMYFAGFYPFPDATYACLNYGEAYAPDEIRKKSICINGDIGEILSQL